MKDALARGVRTFAAAAAGVFTAAAAAVATTGGVVTSEKILVAGLVTAFIAGVAAFALAAAAPGVKPVSAVGKAIATALEVFGSGLAVVSIADVSQVAFENLGTAVLKVAVAAVFAALVTLSVNVSEGVPAV